LNGRDGLARSIRFFKVPVQLLEESE